MNNHPTQYVPEDASSLKIEIVDCKPVSGLQDIDYRRNLALNQSFLKDVRAVSPSYADFSRLHPEETPALIFGSALHTSVLEPNEFDKRYAVAPECDRRTKDGKAVYEDFVYRAGNKRVLKGDDFVRLVAMASISRGMFEDKQSFKSYPELQLYGRIKVTAGTFLGEEIEVKAQLDMLHQSPNTNSLTIQDLKSVADIAKVQKASYENGWAVQSAFYTDLALKVFETTAQVCKFEYIAQSKEPPFDVRKFIVTDEMVIKGRLAYYEAIHKYLWWKRAGKPSTSDFLGVEPLNG